MQRKYESHRRPTWRLRHELLHVSLFAGLPNFTSCCKFSLLHDWKVSGIVPIPSSHSVLYGQSLNEEGDLAEPMIFLIV